MRSNLYSKYSRHRMCAMEYIYFARPDSDIDGCNVHAYRKEAGRRLYRECPVEADIVVGVPDSSLSAANGYAEAAGIPNEMTAGDKTHFWSFRIRQAYLALSKLQP